MSKVLPTGKELFKEIFLEKKCGVDTTTHDPFFKWCAGYSKSVVASCSNITNSQGLNCIINARYTPENITLEPPYFPQVPTGIIYNMKCPNDIQPSKSILWDDAIEKFADRENYLEYNKFCYQEVYGLPLGMPWWLILIIVLVSLLIVTVGGTLFWKYYLRRIMYRHKSTLDNQFTSKPISSFSAARGGSSMRKKPYPASKKFSTAPSVSRQSRSRSLSNSVESVATKRSGSLQTLKV